MATGYDTVGDRQLYRCIVFSCCGRLCALLYYLLGLQKRVAVTVLSDPSNVFVPTAHVGVSAFVLRYLYNNKIDYTRGSRLQAVSKYRYFISSLQSSTFKFNLSRYTYRKNLIKKVLTK